MRSRRTDAPWKLRLYIAGATPKSISALSNLKRICEEHLPEPYFIEVVDLLLNPGRAQTDQIVAIPTLVRKVPEPRRRLIGDLSDCRRVLEGLGIPFHGVARAPQRSR